MSVHRPRAKTGKFKTPFYHYDFQFRGTRFHGSTGETDRRKAEAFEKLRRAEAKAELQAASKINPSSLSEVFGRFWIEKGQHEKGRDTTWYRLERLQDGLTDIFDRRGRPAAISEINDEVVAAYVARRRGQKSRYNRLLSPSSVNREVQLLRRVMRRAGRTWKMTVDMPCWDELLAPEADERLVNIPVDLEERIFARMRVDFRPAARFLILSGLRRGNVLPLHPSNVDFETGVITVHTKSKRPGGRIHVLPITRPMMVILANELAYQHPEAVFTFVAKRTNRLKGFVRGQRYPVHPEAFYREFKAAAVAEGVPELRVHDLRHAAATRTLRATKNLRAAQAQLGHTKISTTTKYTRMLVEDLRDAMEAAHNSGKNPGIKRIPSANR